MFKGVVALAGTLISPLAGQAEPRPNVVVIMADDIGLGDIGFYHRQRTGEKPLAPTPNIDRLIAEGMRFTDAHSPASLCAPTRFSMMTGNFSFRNMRPWGVWTPEADSLIEPEFTTVARIAKAGGYHTSFFGKWGLGGVWTSKNPDYSRVEAGARYYGFDYAVELPQGIQNHPYVFYENQQWMKLRPDSTLTRISHAQARYPMEERAKRDRSGIGDSNWDPSLAGPILAEKAVAYIENQAAVHSGEAFYLYYCSQAVHVPHAPSAELDGVEIADTTPGLHGDMIRELDTQVGMIVEALKGAGVYENTLLVFTSDNGGLVLDENMVEAGHVTSNGLRGHKGSIYEGGHRVPFIAVWPGRIRPNSISDEPIVSHDMVATVAALAGQSLDRRQVRDSTSLLPFFDETADEPAHRYLIHRCAAGPSYALREGDWKLIMRAVLGSETERNYKKLHNGELGEVIPVALFNLKANLAENEAQNLVNRPKFRDRVQAMLSGYKRLREGGEITVFN